ncbi:hypothetical protein C8R48DRAFT_678541 [Suillus tomentosus]|nr:hypothetical protein C8R48DRAFT_678541 [Suillus tomentosus]
MDRVTYEVLALVSVFVICRFVLVARVYEPNLHKRPEYRLSQFETIESTFAVSATNNTYLVCESLRMRRSGKFGLYEFSEREVAHSREYAELRTKARDSALRRPIGFLQCVHGYKVGADRNNHSSVDCVDCFLEIEGLTLSLQVVPQQKQDDRQVHQSRQKFHPKDIVILFDIDCKDEFRQGDHVHKILQSVDSKTTQRHRAERKRLSCPMSTIARTSHPISTLQRVQGKLGGLGETPSKKLKLVPSGKDLLEVSKKDDNTDEIADYCEMTKFLGVGMSASSALGSD